MAREFPKNKIPLPTVGRIVYVYGQNIGPFAAIVTQAWDDTLVADLHVFSCRGRLDRPKDENHPGLLPVSLTVDHYLVPHISCGDTGICWDWMPYQKGQAAKAEQLQAELDKNLASTKTHPLDGKLRQSEERITTGVSPGMIPVQLTPEENARVLDGKLRQSEDDERYKNAGPVPSPEDGKR
jgi:hypothetical protein